MKLESNERAQRGRRQWRLGAALVILALVAMAGADEHGDEPTAQDRLTAPGVDEDMVATLMEARPYADPAAVQPCRGTRTGRAQ